MLTQTYVRDETGIKCSLIGSFLACACKLYRALSFPARVKAPGALRKDYGRSEAICTDRVLAKGFHCQ